MSQRTPPPRRLRMPLWGKVLVATLMVGGPIAAASNGTPLLGLLGVLFGWVALDLIERTRQHRNHEPEPPDHESGPPMIKIGKAMLALMSLAAFVAMLLGYVMRSPPRPQHIPMDPVSPATTTTFGGPR